MNVKVALVRFDGHAHHLEDMMVSLKQLCNDRVLPELARAVDNQLDASAIQEEAEFLVRHSTSLVLMCCVLRIHIHDKKRRIHPPQTNCVEVCVPSHSQMEAASIIAAEVLAVSCEGLVAAIDEFDSARDEAMEEAGGKAQMGARVRQLHGVCVAETHALLEFITTHFEKDKAERSLKEAGGTGGEGGENQAETAEEEKLKKAAALFGAK
jgi:hypothetical protein